MDDIDRMHLIDQAIQNIEAYWIEYNNGSKTAEEAQNWQRFTIEELLEDLARK